LGNRSSTPTGKRRKPATEALQGEDRACDDVVTASTEGLDRFGPGSKINPIRPPAHHRQTLGWARP